MNKVFLVNMMRACEPKELISVFFFFNWGSKNLILTAIREIKTRASDSGQNELLASVKCLPSRWTVSVKSAGSCQVK